MWQCNSICLYPVYNVEVLNKLIYSLLRKGHHLSQTVAHQTAAFIVSSLAPSGWKLQTPTFRGVTESPKMTPECVPGAPLILFSSLLTKQQVWGVACIYSNSSEINIKYSGWKLEIKNQTIIPTFIHLCDVIFYKHMSHCSTHFGRKPQKVASIPPFQKVIMWQYMQEIEKHRKLHISICKYIHCALPAM